MKSKFSIFTLAILLPACCLLTPRPARAQIYAGAYAEQIQHECAALKIVAAALEKIPREAAQAENFTPPHWKIEQSATADFDGDGRKDYALSFYLDEKDRKYLDTVESVKNDIPIFGVPHIVAVLLAGEGGKLRLEAVNYRLETTAADPHTFFIGVEKNTLVVNAVYGGGNQPLRNYVFRFGWQNKSQFQLIGFDVDNGKGNETRVNDYKVSDNFLTGERVETNYVADKTRKGRFVSAVKRFRFVPMIIEFVEARLNDNLQTPY